jgi:AI-2 transport protein TqsA
VTDPSVTDRQRGLVPRGLIVVLGGTGLLVGVLALREFATIVGPVLLALILVIGVHPLTGILRRRGAPMWLAASVTLLALVLLIFGLAASLALSVAQLAALVPAYQDSLTALINDLRAWLGSIGVGPDQLHAALGEISFANVAGLVTDLLAGFASVFSNMLFLLFVVAFMAIDATGFSRRLVRARSQRADVVGALDTFVHGTRSYLLVSTVFGLIVAAIDTGLLWLLGVPLPLLWGLLAFITNYIPNIGFIIGLLPPALLALLEGGPRLMLIVIVAYSVINFIIQSIIQPKIMADAVNLSLTLTFLSLVFWAFVIGPIGALLAVPLTLLMKALLLDVDPSTRWISSLLEGGPAPPEEDHADEDAATPPREPEAPADHLTPSTDGQESRSADPESPPDQLGSRGPDRPAVGRPGKGEDHDT